MLGQPIYMTSPQVVGVRLSGALASGVTATDLVLTMTERLRQHGVVGKFIEFFGPGLGALTVADRATISNMSPEFGATASTFPVDGQTLRYLRDTGRSADHVDLVERYTREQGLFRDGSGPEPAYTETLDFDLSAVEPSLAGPRRPQDRVVAPAGGSQLRRRLRSEAKRRRPGRRIGGHLGDHVVHEHLEPRADGGGGPRRPQGRRARAHDEAVGEDEPRPGVACGRRLPAPGGAHGAARAARVQPRRVRLHDLHRELRPAPRRRGRRDRPRRPEGRGGPLGEPQLRGPHPPGRARQLPRVAAAGRGLRARRHRERRPHRRAAGRGERRAACTCATCGRRPTR